MSRDSETGAASTRKTRRGRVLVTGASGFVGREVTAKLVKRGYKPVCLVRDRERFLSRAQGLSPAQIEAVQGDLFDKSALAEAAEGVDAAIHLVGIIAERRLAGQTFERVHVEGTRRVIEACSAAGVRRFLHMSALGTREGAVSR
ncbi:MAG: SDR family NAD(P)-dependent oxidoreductase, partial [Planctomycetota bacterium]